MKNKGDIYLQGFICLLQVLSIVAIKLQILTEIFQSWSQIPSLQVKRQDTVHKEQRQLVSGTLLMAFSQLPLFHAYADLPLSVSTSHSVSVPNTCLVVTE